ESMASGHISRLANLFNTITVIHLQLLHVRLHPYQIKRRCVACFSKMHGFCFSDVEIAVTSDGNTIVCYHPTEDVPYELTQPIVRPDAVSDHAETHEQVLKARLGKEVLNNKQAPTIEELSKMFYTTKHRWYPVGQYHTRRRKPNPPKDR
uniref:Large ribosomal subunit protein mL42 n=1 Tax=Cyprinus carpio TaxID=7962 RepID=A0A8C2C2T9_CYPCA